MVSKPARASPSSLSVPWLDRKAERRGERHAPDDDDRGVEGCYFFC